MNKRIIVTKNQLNEYIERKKAKKIFNSILEDMYKNSKYLNENISLKRANQTIIDKYKLNNKLNEKVLKLLEDNNIINNKGQII
jgi:biotin-(acetyl-CoA carboxylase) ligase